MLILGIESSCDETAAAIVRDGRVVLSSVVASQIEEHRKYGGVVPEIASRRHIENVGPVCELALKEAGVTLGELDAVAATAQPGLIGALLAGLSFAKGLSYAANKPLVAVNHLHGHIASLYLTHEKLEPPFMALVVSGGHSHLFSVSGYTDFKLVGRAVDDAAGEAFDKIARTIGLPYPGGPEISRLALTGDKNKYKLPVPHTDGEFDVSFSGLKTHVINLVNTAKMKGEELDLPSLAAAFEDRVCDMLAQRLVEAAKEYSLPACVCGGVSLNRRLREYAQERCKKANVPFYAPDPSLCGDNAAMIASAGYYDFVAGKTAPLSQNACATLQYGENE